MTAKYTVDGRPVEMIGEPYEDKEEWGYEDFWDYKFVDEQSDGATHFICLSDGNTRLKRVDPPTGEEENG